MTWLKQNGPRPDHLGSNPKLCGYYVTKTTSSIFKMRKYWFYLSLKWTLGIMMTDIGSRYILVGKIIFTKTNRSNSAFSSCLNIGIKLSQWWIRITLKTETLRWTNIISHPQRGGQRMLKTKQRRLEIELWTRCSFSCFIRPGFVWWRLIQVIHPSSLSPELSKR